MHQMDFSTEQLEGIQPVPNGIYRLRLIGFEPKASKAGDSINLNPIFQFIDPEYSERPSLRYSFTGNTKIPSFLQDLVHATGLEMEEDGDKSRIPGFWDGDKQKYDAKDPSTYVYSGPLLNQELQAEVVQDEYQGRVNNKIRKFICAVPNCAERFPKIRHAEDMNRKKA